MILGLPKHECLHCYPVATERHSQRHLATGLRLQHSYIGATKWRAMLKGRFIIRNIWLIRDFSGNININIDLCIS